MYKTPLELKVEALEERVRMLEGKSGKAMLPHDSWTTPSSDEPVAKQPQSQPTQPQPHASGSTELWLGRQGLSFIGTALLLLGLAFLLVYSIQYLGAWGRDLLGLGTAVVLFGLSRYLEPKSKPFSQFLFAGSAALAYFTVYAMHFFDVSRVIQSQMLDLGLLLLVAAASTWYTLKRYNDEGGTALAYALIYLTFFVGDLSLFSFWALLLATLGIVGVASWKQWPGALLAGVLLTYGTYLFWGTALGGTAQLFGSSSQLTFDSLFLGLYFLLFAIPILRFKEGLEQSPALVFALNSVAFTLLMAYSLGSVEHGTAYLLFGLTIFQYLYALVAHMLDKPQLRAAATSLGSVALFGAIAFYWTDVSLFWAWLLVGATELLLSLALRDRTLRMSGIIGILLAAAHFFVIDLLMSGLLGNTILSQNVLLGGALAIVTLGIAQLLAFKEGLTASARLRLLLNLIGLSALVAVAGVELESTYITLAWGLLGVLTLLAGIGLKDQQLRNPAFVVILLMLARAVFIDLAQAETIIRVISFIILGVVLLGASWVYHRYITDETPVH